MIETVLDVAAIIYSNNIDLNSPLLWKQTAKKAIQAAEAYGKYIQEYKKENIEVDVEYKVSEIKKFINNNPGKKIDWIKEIRTKFGIGLKEAKQTADFYEINGKIKIISSAFTYME